MTKSIFKIILPIIFIMYFTLISLEHYLFNHNTTNFEIFTLIGIGVFFILSQTEKI